MPDYRDISHFVNGKFRVYGDRDVYILEEPFTAFLGRCEKYRARNLRGERKLIKLPSDYDADGMAAHRKEKLALWSLSHPCVPKLYDTQREGDVPFLVLDYIEGKNLNSRRLNRKQVKGVFIQLCETLEYLSGQGIVHREINPENIILREAEDSLSALLIDFELWVPKGFVEAEFLEGIFGYFSPEQFSGDRLPLDTRSDIYMLGLTLYKTATGRLPFCACIAPETIYSMKWRNSLPDPRRFCHDIDPLLTRIIMKTLRADPLERYQIPAEMIEDLRKVPDWI